MENIFIHDNTINALIIDFNDERISMETTSENSRKLNINFKDVLAHKFDYAIKHNILLDIVENTIGDFIEEFQESLWEWSKYGFPTDPSNCEEFERYIVNHKYRIFIIQASLGLSGFIIAKSIDFIPV